jgi:hypothetical protein
MNTTAPADAAPAGHVLTGELFREVSTTETANELVAVGLALHHFTELAREFAPIDAIELHRATTILTRQVVRLLADGAPLEEICELVTDPNRVATVDRRTVAELCGERWPTIHRIATERATAAIEGSRTFGSTTVLHLAATRAVRPQCSWWGTDGWAKRVDEWLAAHPSEPELRAALEHTPEGVGDDVLGDLIEL